MSPALFLNYINSLGAAAKKKGKILLEGLPAIPRGLELAVSMPLIEALHGRRARRFALGAEIPDGPLKFKSRHEPMPLSELEQMMVLTAAAGNTGWFYKDMRAAVEAFVARKFGANGPFNSNTPGPYRENARVRGSGKVHSEEFKDCVTTGQIPRHRAVDFHSDLSASAPS